MDHFLYSKNYLEIILKLYKIYLQTFWICAILGLVQISISANLLKPIVSGGDRVARKRVNTTKCEIIQHATKLFLEVGYSATPPKRICDELDISTGNLTYYFPTKEHLLTVLVKMLCDFQRKLLQDAVEEGQTSLLAVCLELVTMTAASEENESAKDLFLSSYSSPMCLEIIRKNDNERAKMVYGEFCSDWDEEQFAEAETLVSGIEYATLMTTDVSAPLEMRITGALNNIMRIYNVPEELRKTMIQKVLKMDYRTLGKTVLENFKDFVYQTNELSFQTLQSDVEQFKEVTV